MEKPKLRANTIGAAALGIAFILIAVPISLSNPATTIIQDNGIEIDNLWLDNIYELGTLGITTRNIRDNTILNADICDNTIDASDSLLDNSITSAKIQDSTIASVDIGENVIAYSDMAIKIETGRDNLADGATENFAEGPYHAAPVVVVSCENYDRTIGVENITTTTFQVWVIDSSGNMVEDVDGGGTGYVTWIAIYAP